MYLLSHGKVSREKVLIQSPTLHLLMISRLLAPSLDRALKMTNMLNQMARTHQLPRFCLASPMVGDRDLTRMLGKMEWGAVRLQIREIAPWILIELMSHQLLVRSPLWKMTFIKIKEPLPWDSHQHPTKLLCRPNQISPRNWSMNSRRNQRISPVKFLLCTMEKHLPFVLKSGRSSVFSMPMISWEMLRTIVQSTTTWESVRMTPRVEWGRLIGTEGFRVLVESVKTSSMRDSSKTTSIMVGVDTSVPREFTGASSTWDSGTVKVNGSALMAVRLKVTGSTDSWNEHKVDNIWQTSYY